MSKGSVYALCTTKTIKAVYDRAKERDTAEECEKLLKTVGLHGIEVCKLLTWLGAYLYLYITIWIECILDTQEFRPIHGPFI